MSEIKTVFLHKWLLKHEIPYVWGLMRVYYDDNTKKVVKKQITRWETSKNANRKTYPETIFATDDWKKDSFAKYKRKVEQDIKTFQSMNEDNELYNWYKKTYEDYINHKNEYMPFLYIHIGEQCQKVSIFDQDTPYAFMNVCKENNMNANTYVFKTPSISSKLYAELKDERANRFHVWFKHNPDITTGQYEGFDLLGSSSNQTLFESPYSKVPDIDVSKLPELPLCNVSLERYQKSTHTNEKKERKTKGKINMRTKGSFININSYIKPIRTTCEQINVNYEADSTNLYLLSCIPNNNGFEQPVGFWRAIGAVCYALEDLGLEAFINWSNQTDKWGDQTEACNRWFEQLEDYRQKFPKAKEYNRGSLFNVAKEYIKQPIKKLLNSQMERFMLRPTALPNTHIYGEPYVQELNYDERIVLLKSHLGTGKTTAVKRYIEEYEPERVIWLSARRIFARNLHTDLNKLGLNFKCYLDHTDESNLGKYNRMIVQMESLHKLYKLLDEYVDLVVVDEIESCLNQFNSEETMKHDSQCAKIFEHLIANSGKVILADAFLSNRTIDVLKALDMDEDEMKLVINETNPFQRKAIEYKGGKKKDMLLETLQDKLLAGKRCIFLSASSVFTNQIEQALKGIKMKEGDDYKIYKAGSNDLKNVNEDWNGLKCVVYTSAITVGVNFDLRDKFDILFMYGSAYKSCCVRDLFQGSLRVRHLKDQTLYYAINTMSDVKQPIFKLKQAFDVLDAKAEQVQQDLDKFPETIIKNGIKRSTHAPKKGIAMPLWVKTAKAYSITEMGLCKANYEQMFNLYLELCGYEKEKDDSDFDGVKWGELEEVKYDDVPEISFREYKVLKQDAVKGLCTIDEMRKMYKYMMEYRYLRFLDWGNIDNETKNKVFQAMLDNNGRKHIRNINLERKQQTYEIAIGTGNYNSHRDSTYKLHSTVKSICELIGIEHSIQETNINGKQLEAIADKLNEIIKELKIVQKWNKKHDLNMKAPSKKQQSKGIQAKNQINQIFQEWNGSKLDNIKNDSGSNKKQNGSYVYQLTNQYFTANDVMFDMDKIYM